MTQLEFDVDGQVFVADLLKDEAPRSVEVLRDVLPLESELMHVRWYGHTTWINIDEIGLSEIPCNLFPSPIVETGECRRSNHAEIFRSAGPQ